MGTDYFDKMFDRRKGRVADRRGQRPYQRRVAKRRPFWTTRSALAAIAVILIAGLLIGGCSLWFSSHKTRTLTITRLDDQARSSRHGNGHVYMVFTKQGVFEDTDSLLFLKFNSSDVWGQLEVGRTYRCDTVGWRVPQFSWYPNIVGCKTVR